MNMKRYKKNKMILFGTLAILLILCLTACSFLKQDKEFSEGEEQAAQRVSKETEEQESSLVLSGDGEKTVYAKADAEGNVQEITVETLMKDEDGEEFRYKEETDEELPVSVKISYYLDGEQIAPEELAGKSGKVKLRFDYENVTSTSNKSTDLTPFAAITALALPSDTFSNVEVENGKVVSVEGQSMVVGYALPGIAEYLELNTYEPTEKMEIPEYVEITADVTEFELEFTTTVITNGLLEELEEEDLDDIDEMADSMEELGDASEELVKGTGELYNGMEEFQGYLNDFSEGTDAVSEGATALKDGLKTINENKDELEAGAVALNDGLKALVQAIASTGSGDGAGSRQQSAAEQELLAMLQEMELTEEQQAQMLASIQAIVAEQTTGAFSDIKSSVESLQAGSQALSDGITAYNQGLDQVYEGAEQLSDGASELSKAGAELSDGFTEVVKGVGTLKDGFEEFDREGIQKLEDLAGAELKTIVSRLRKLKEADGDWKGFSDGAEKEAAMKIILETEEIQL